MTLVESAVDDIEDIIVPNGVHNNQLSSNINGKPRDRGTSSNNLEDKSVQQVRIRKFNSNKPLVTANSSNKCCSVNGKGDCEGGGCKSSSGCADDDDVLSLSSLWKENGVATTADVTRVRSSSSGCSDGDGEPEPMNGNEDEDNDDLEMEVMESPDVVRPVPIPPVCSSNDLNPKEYVVYLKTWGCSHNNSDSEYMAGLLAVAGFNVTTTAYDSASLVILNSCTVKGPSEDHFKNEITKATSSGKHLVLAGCVSQSDKSYRKIASVIGVQQIDRIVEVVEETLKGNKLSFVSAKRRSDDNGQVVGGRGPGADLALPKIRKNDLIEIVPVSTGCLNNCTYCKTKMARGQLASYSINSIVTRIDHVIKHENIKEIWLTSEDLGAWGIDLGLTIVDLLNAIVNVLSSTRVMLRLGMTNPPYILDHLEEISKILSHPNVYGFLHIPVQSGSDSVLLEMKREYSRKDFERICDFLLERLPKLTIATDIICGYPTETEVDFEDTFTLINKYKFPVLFINRFYPRSGTAAAKLKRIPTHIVKARTKRLHELFQSYTSITTDLVSTTQRVLVTEIAHDKVKFVGHNKYYQQVLLDENRIVGSNNENKVDLLMGQWVDVEIVEVGKFSMIGGDGSVVCLGNEKTIKEIDRVSRIRDSARIIAMIIAMCLVVVAFSTFQSTTS